MISDQTKELLRVADLPGMGAVALRKHIETARECGVAEELHHRSAPMVSNLLIVNRELNATKKQRAMEILEKCFDHEISIISALDDLYPPLLRRIRDYPPILYVRGNVSALSGVGCAVVGTREASRLGISWAKQIAEIFAQENYSIVSGLALGIDAAAHEGALRADGRTVAILAHGLDQVTPSSNRKLADRILQSGGCWMSEHPPGVPPRKAEYVRRNRLQSGMSVCSVVVESGREGGAIHQARFTMDQGRKLFTVLPDPATQGASEFNEAGPRRLIEEMHAQVLRKRDDLMRLIQSGFFPQNYDSLVKGQTAAPTLI